MQQQWNLKTRAHECARTGRLFEPGEIFYTAIYFDTAQGEFLRRDVGMDVWREETAEKKPLAYWKTEYEPPEGAKPKAEISTKENAESLLRRLIEEDETNTENARYILTLMLERKKLLAPKEIQETEQGKMLIYEHRKSGEVYIVRDPELLLREIDAVQEEVAMLLGLGSPAADAAAAAGMKILPDGSIVPDPDAKVNKRVRRNPKARAVAAEAASEGTEEAAKAAKRGRKPKEAEAAPTVAGEATPDLVDSAHEGNEVQEATLQAEEVQAQPAL